MLGGRNDMQRINGLRIEEESRRRDEETKARLTRGQDFDSDPRTSRVGAILGRFRRALRR